MSWMISGMSSLPPNTQKVLVLLSNRPVSVGGSSPLIRRYRLARLRPAPRPVPPNALLQHPRLP